MGEVITLDRFVDKGWHALSGYIGHGMQPLASRYQNSEPSYDKRLGGHGAGLLLPGSNIAYNIPHSRNRIYQNVGIIPNGGVHDSISEQAILGTPPNHTGLVKTFEVYQESLSPRTEPELITPATKGFLGFGAKPAEYRERPREKSYIPVYSDAQGNITTKSNGNERLFGMIFEFPDPRWPRGHSTAQYSVVLREFDYQQLHKLIKKDPSLMLQLLFTAFPEYQKLEAKDPFIQPSNFVFAETLEELLRLRNQKQI